MSKFFFNICAREDKAMTTEHVKTAIWQRLAQTGYVLDPPCATNESTDAFFSIMRNRCATLTTKDLATTAPRIPCLRDNCFRNVFISMANNVTLCVCACEFVDALVHVLTTADINDAAYIWRTVVTHATCLPAFVGDIILSIGFVDALPYFVTLRENIWLYVMGDKNYQHTVNVHPIVQAYTRMLAQKIPLCTMCVTGKQISSNLLMYCLSECMVNSGLSDKAQGIEEKFNCGVSKHYLFNVIAGVATMTEDEQRLVCPFIDAKPDVYSAMLMLMNRYRLDTATVAAADKCAASGEIHEFKILTVMRENALSVDAAFSYLKILARQIGDVLFLSSLDTMVQYVKRAHDGLLDNVPLGDVIREFMNMFDVGAFENIDMVDVVTNFTTRSDAVTRCTNPAARARIQSCQQHMITSFVLNDASREKMAVAKPYIFTDECVFVVLDKHITSQQRMGAALFALVGGARIENGQRLPVYAPMARLFFSGIHGIRWTVAIIHLWLTGNVEKSLKIQATIAIDSDPYFYKFVVTIIAALLSPYTETDLFFTQDATRFALFAEVFLAVCLYEATSRLKTFRQDMPAEGTGLKRVPAYVQAQLAAYRKHKNHKDFLDAINIFKVADLGTCNIAARPLSEFQTLTAMLSSPPAAVKHSTCLPGNTPDVIQKVLLFFAVLDMRLMGKRSGEFCMQHFDVICQSDVTHSTYPVFYNPCTNTYVNDEDIFFIDHIGTSATNRVLASSEQRPDMSGFLERALSRKLTETSLQSEIFTLVKKFNSI